MDHWHPFIVRIERPDATRQWADLEGKSATMRDDLRRQRGLHGMPLHAKYQQTALLAELLITVVDALWHSR